MQMQPHKRPVSDDSEFDHLDDSKASKTREDSLGRAASDFLDQVDDDADGSDLIDKLNEVFDKFNVDERDGSMELEVEVPSETIPLCLRPYQEELSEAVCSEEQPNTLVTCETNSGKTLVAVQAILKWRARNPEAKFAFVTHKVSLCVQQYKVVCKFVPSKSVVLCHGELSRAQNVFLQSGFSGMEKLEQTVFVFTAQTFLNLIDRKVVSLKEFTLVVFDECHHADGKDPYNEVMLNYLDLKFQGQDPRDNLPQIMGLTASPTLFKTSIKDEDTAQQMLKALIFNMDSEKLSFVTKQLADLRSYCRPSEEHIEYLPSESKMKFAGAIESLMKAQILFLQKEYRSSKIAIDGKGSSFCLNFDFPTPMCAKAFEQWSRDLGTKDSKVPAFQFSLSFTAKLLTELSLILRLTSTIEPWILHERIKNMYEDDEWSGSDLETRSTEFDRQHKALADVYAAHKDKLDNAAFDSKTKKDHKMMNRLKSVILKELVGENANDSEKNRAIVFVPTKYEAETLKFWANIDEDLKVLKADFITAQVKNQMQLLNGFKNGDCRLLFATSVIEEGIDIPDCKLVVNYNNRVNHIQQLQQKGRARMNNGQYYVISCDADCDGMARDNQMRQRFTESAVANVALELDNPVKMRNLGEEKKKSQEVAVFDYLKRKSAVKKGKENSCLFSFRCQGCTSEVFLSNDIFKFKGDLRIVLTPSLQWKFKAKPAQRSGKEQRNTKFFESRNLQQTQLLFCFNCKQHLGQLLKCGFFGVVNPKVAQFFIAHSDGCGSETCTKTDNWEKQVYKNWGKLPFDQKPITALEVKKYFIELQKLAKEDRSFQQMVDDEPILL